MEAERIKIRFKDKTDFLLNLQSCIISQAFSSMFIMLTDKRFVSTCRLHDRLSIDGKISRKY